MKQVKKFQSEITLAFVFLITFHLIFYFLFRYLDKSAQTWDSAGHLALTIRITEHFKSFATGGTSTLYDIISESNYYPPLFHFMIAFLDLFFGYSVSLQLFWVFVIFIISLIVFYFLLRELNFSEKISFSTVFIYSLFPLVADQFRLFHLETPLILFILLCYLFLKKSQFFQNKTYSFLFFIFFGFLQLIKWYGFLFLIVPGIYCLYQGYLISKNKLNLYKNIIFGSILFLFICLPWYLVNLTEIRLLSSLFSRGELDDLKDTYSLTNLIFYFQSLSVYGIYLIPLLFSFVGMFFYTKDNKKFGLLLIIQIMLVYLTFTFIENKNIRYVFGLNIFFAFLVAYFIEKLNFDWLRVGFYSFMILAFLISSFNQFKPFSTDSKIWGYIFAGPLTNWYQISPMSYSYKSNVIPVKDILQFIVQDAQTNGIKDIGITSLVDYENLSTATLELETELLQNKNIYLPVPYYQFTPFKSDYEILRFFRDKNVSYVIVPDFAGPKGLRNKEALDQSIDFIRNRGSQWFELVKKFEYIDNGFEIYRVKNQDNTIKLNTCVSEKELSQKFYTIAPLSSLLVFTGNFSFKDISQKFVPNNIYLLEITNYTTQSKPVQLYDLPKNGFTVCDRLGTLLKIKKEISNALVFDGKSCGDLLCQTVTHIKYNMDNPQEKSIIVYDKNYFLGKNPFEKTLKKLKIVPLYEKEYNELKDAFGEYYNTNYYSK